MGLVNTVVPLAELEARRSSGAARCSSTPARAAAAEGELQRGRGWAQRDPARTGARREPPLLRQRRGEGGPRGLQGEAPADSASSQESGLETRSSLGRGRTATHASRPPSRRFWSAPPYAISEEEGQSALPFAAALVVSALHADRDEPRQRLLGRPPRRGHRGPARPGARDGGRPDAAEARPDGYLRRVRDRARRRASTIAAVASWWLLAGRRGLPSPRASSVHGRAAARTATPGSARCSCSSSSASSPSSARTTCRPKSSTWEAFALSVPVWPARVGDPRREQRPRHRHRPACGEAHAGGEAGPRGARASALHGDGLRRVRLRAAAVAARLRRAVGVAAARAAGGAARRAGWCGSVRTRTDGPSLNGALARHRHARARVLRRCCPRASWRADGRARRHEPSSLRLRAPLRAAWGELAERELPRGADRLRRGRLAARARRRRSSPTTASRARRRRGRAATPTARCSRGRARARRTPSCSPPARAERDAARRRWRRSTSRCGTCAGRRDGRSRSRSCIAAGAVARRWPVNATIARGRPRRAPPRRRQRRPRRASAALKMKVGDRRRRGPAWPRCAPRSAPRWRSGSTPTAPGTSADEALAQPARAGARGHRAVRGAGPRRSQAMRDGARASPRCRWRWTRRPPSAARPAPAPPTRCA